MAYIEQIFDKYNPKVNGVIHVGAHIGGEYNFYRDKNVKAILFFEPSPVNFNRLKNNVPSSDHIILVDKALGNFNGKSIMYVESSNNGMSNSLLEPKEHLTIYPNIEFNGQIEIDVVKLDDYLINISNSDFYNFINMDAQGYELEVLKGSVETLKHIDYVYTEVNARELYKDGANVNDLTNFLEENGFNRIEIQYPVDVIQKGRGWCDAFYMRKK